MLLLLPTPVVPLLVIAGVLVAKTVDIVRGVSAPQRLPLAGGYAAFALAPAVVLVAADAQLPDWAAWPAYAVGARRAVRGRHRPRHRDRPPDRRRADAGRAP